MKKLLFFLVAILISFIVIGETSSSKTNGISQPQETTKPYVLPEITPGPAVQINENATYKVPSTKPKSTNNYCLNGTYINSFGNEVCRPQEFNNGGATAVCADGTYSYSQSRRGTCSHHGGISR